MRVLLKQDPKRGLSIVERDRPEPASDEALVRVSAAGICGTDLDIYSWKPWVAGRMRLPVVLGHEGTGIVEDVGSDVTRVAVGDRVGIESHVPCGSCRNCLSGSRHICSSLTYLGMHLDGVFAKYVVVPEVLLFSLPDELSDDVAVLLEPLGLAIRAAKSGTGVAAKSVLITGLGPLGAMTCPIARRFGATRVLASEVAPYRLEYGREHSQRLGIDRVIDAATEDVGAVARDFTDGDGIDLWIDFTGDGSALRQGLEALRPGGEAHLFAPSETPSHLTPLILKEITAYGLHGRLIYDTWFDTVSVLRDLQHALAPLVTHLLAFDDYERAFALAQEARTMKVVLRL